jgi:hypothetical protein
MTASFSLGQLWRGLGARHFGKQFPKPRKLQVLLVACPGIDLWRYSVDRFAFFDWF